MEPMRAKDEPQLGLPDAIGEGSTSAAAGDALQVLENLRAMIVEGDETGRLLYISPTVRDLLGY